MKLTALVPMKGNSERLPDKNINRLKGKPLFYYILDTLFNSKHIEQVIINTDSEEIIKLAQNEYGKKIIIHERPKVLCGDYIEMNKIIDYDINKVDDEYFLQTHATNPLMEVSTLEKAIDFFGNNQDVYDSLFTVTRLNSRLYDNNAKPINHSLSELLRTQDLVPIFEENSNLYIFSKKSFYNAKCNRIGKKPSMFEMDKIESIDIDDKEDFALAQMLIKKD